MLNTGIEISPQKYLEISNKWSQSAYAWTEISIWLYYMSGVLGEIAGVALQVIYQWILKYQNFNTYFFNINNFHRIWMEFQNILYSRVLNQFIFYLGEASSLNVYIGGQTITVGTLSRKYYFIKQKIYFILLEFFYLKFYSIILNEVGSNE